MTKAQEFIKLTEDNQIRNKWTEENYRILVKNDQGKFMPIDGISSGKPMFVTNVINGLVLWNLDPDAAKDKFDAIRSKYPDLEFKFVKA